MQSTFYIAYYNQQPALTNISSRLFVKGIFAFGIGLYKISISMRQIGRFCMKQANDFVCDLKELDATMCSQPWFLATGQLKTR
jgi:hypothetical protein